jgi:2'-5' RNA ligase
MNLFVAIAPSPEVTERVRAFVDTLHPRAPLRWSAPADLHVTTHFIGEWPLDKAGVLEEALRGMPAHAPFSLALRGVGWFPDARAPRVFWAGTDAPPALHALAASTARALASVGVPLEERAYSPHLTLARVPPQTKLDALREAISAPDALDFGAWTVDRFALYGTAPRGVVPHYQELASFRLAASP